MRMRDACTWCICKSAHAYGVVHGIPRCASHVHIAALDSPLETLPPLSHRYVHVDSIRNIMGAMGSQRLGDKDLDELIALLGPDAEGRVNIERFRSAECWQIPDGHPVFRKRLSREATNPSRTDVPAVEQEAAGSSSG